MTKIAPLSAEEIAAIERGPQGEPDWGYQALRNQSYPRALEGNRRWNAAKDGIEDALLTLEFHGCNTGDCPHDHVKACAEALSQAIAEHVTEVRALLTDGGSHAE